MPLELGFKKADVFSNRVSEQLRMAWGMLREEGMSARERYLGFWSVSREELEKGARGQKGVVMLWG